MEHEIKKSDNPTISDEHETKRESIKCQIRQRVNNSRIPENAVIRKAKPKPSINDIDDKMVAIYARVSTSSLEQVSSIENQTRYYTEKIESTPNWNMTEVYADEGKSGTSIKRRPAFQKMIRDAKEEKMDLILCASVSRFARNMSECMDQISELKTANPTHPVGVYFETENIYTLDPDCNQALSIHAMLADWESANKSSRMILSYDQRICMGQFPVSDLLGYRHTKDGQLIVQDDEAVTVKYIFMARAAGHTFSEIAEVLTEKQRPTLTGRTQWDGSMVRNILENERRWGDLEVRKRIVIDYKKRKTIRNIDTRDSAFVPNHHEPIVSREIAKASHLAVSGCGVPDISLIRNSALKGFVSVHPSFTGINAEIIANISKKAYSEEEYENLSHIENIINGEEHSKIMSMDFSGYYVPNSAFFINMDTPTLTINRSHFKFNKKCIERLDCCEYVEILYHPILQMISIRPSDRSNNNAICWRKEDKSNVLKFWSRTLSEAIYNQLDWIKEYGFKFKGITKVRGQEKMLFFFLDEPQIVVPKKIKEQLNVKNEQYIPYRNKEVIEQGKMSRADQIAAQIGMNYHLRKRRNQLMNSITEDDMRQKGIIQINPLIGKAISKSELEQELDDLLMIM